MISARRLAEVHGSFWDLLAPNLPRVVRSLNLSGRDVFAPPMVSAVATDRLYLVNEFGFELYMRGAQGLNYSVADIMLSIAEKFSGNPNISQFNNKLSVEEMRDATDLAQRIDLGIPHHIQKDFKFSRPSSEEFVGIIEENVVPVQRPYFKGVGLLDNCEGDIRFAKYLIEVKSGERNLRSNDFRQVLIYYSLSVLNDEFPVSSCIIINPRQGYRIEIEFNDLVSAISGKSIIEFIATFRDYLVDWKECD